MTTIDEPPVDQPPPPEAAAAVDQPPTEWVAKKKHSCALRWMHWINFPVLMIMMYSGMRIYWADLRDPYAIGIGGWTWFTFWPDGWEEFLQLDRKLAAGIAFHLNFGWFFVINGLLYAVYLSRKGNWRYLVPDRRALRDVPATLAHELKLRKTAPPRGKYNAMQQLSYTAVLIIAFLLVASGFAIYKPVQLSWLVTMFGGYGRARWVHFTSTILLFGFFFVHVFQVARSGWRNAASMVTGYRLERRPVASETTSTSSTGEPQS